MENEKAKVEMVKFSVPRLTDKELDNMQFMLIEKIGLLRFHMRFGVARRRAVNTRF